MSQQINLFNPVFQKQKKYFSALALAQTLGVMVAGAIVLAAYGRFQLSRLDLQVAASNAQLAAVQKQLEEFKAQAGTRQKSKTLEDEVWKRETEVKSLQLVFDILQKGEFGDTKGYSEYMQAFARQIVGGVWLTGFNISGAGAEIGLQGRALQPELVPLYIGRLKNELVMQGKSFAALEMQVPQVEQTEHAGKDSVVAVKRVSAKYIDFNLQSSVKPSEQAGLLGMKSK